MDVGVVEAQWPLMPWKGLALHVPYPVEVDEQPRESLLRRC